MHRSSSGAHGSPAKVVPADVRVVMSGRLVSERAEELHGLLLGALDSGATVEVDLGQTTELDGVGVQLLLFAKRTAAARRQKLCVVQESPAVREVFDRLGLRTIMGGPLLCIWSEELAS